MFQWKKYKLEEQAAIIIMSESGTIEEKIQDLRTLMDTYTDEHLQISAKIKMVIALWNDILDDRYRQEGVIFLAALQEKGLETDRLSAYRFFSTYQRALEFLLKEKEAYQISEDLRTIETYGEIWRMELDTDGPDCDVYCFDREMNLNKILCCSDRPQKVSLLWFEEIYGRLCEETDHE